MPNKGKIAQIIGPVVDVSFSNNASLPKIYDALEIKKVELASNLLGTEETDETTNATIEADGTDGSTDIQHEPTAEESADTEQN